MEHKDPFILHGEYYGCWWPGDAKDQGISCHGIHQSSPGILQSISVSEYDE